MIRRNKWYSWRRFLRKKNAFSLAIRFSKNHFTKKRCLYYLIFTDILSSSFTDFVLSMAYESYDTCPVEGSDTWRVKKVLNLPRGAEINMIVSCGVRKPQGVYGDRFRIPFKEVYRQV